MKKIKLFTTLVLVCALILSCLTVSANAATDPTNYAAYTTPSSSDYAYWNGSSVVKASGTTTSEIKWMQASLNYCKKNKGLALSAYLTVDGSFGPASKAACTAFQKKYGLTQDGSFGPSTIAKMKSVLSAGTSSASTSTTSTTTSYSSYTAPTSTDYAYWDGSKVVKASGTTTSEIKWMQAALNYCIVNKGLSASKLTVDGSFGPASKTTTTAFQKKFGLSADGSFGSATIARMKEVLAGTYPKTTTQSGVTRVEYVNSIKETFFSTVTSNSGTLDMCYEVAWEVFGSKEFLNKLGVAAGSAPSGFATAVPAMIEDPELFLGIAQLEIARILVNRAKAAGEKVLSYRGKTFTNTSAIEFMEAYRDYSANNAAAIELLRPIIDEYASVASKSKTAQVAYLVNIFCEGTLDGLLGNLDGISEAADYLLELRDHCSTASAFVDAALPEFSAYSVYQSRYTTITNIINNVKKM